MKSNYNSHVAIGFPLPRQKQRKADRARRAWKVSKRVRRAGGSEGRVKEAGMMRVEDEF